MKREIDRLKQENEELRQRNQENDDSKQRNEELKQENDTLHRMLAAVMRENDDLERQCCDLWQKKGENGGLAEKKKLEPENEVDSEVQVYVKDLFWGNSL